MDHGENSTSFNQQSTTAASDHQVKNIIAIMSGKGGVGKSLVTGLLACGLAKKGCQVGVLDADITGPSIPKLFGLHGPVKEGPLGILPLKSRNGIDVMSMNLLLENENQPVIMRGPLLSKVIEQMWQEVMWGKLDYLLVDLPPGTSDAALTILQSLPIKGVLMVTTPQSLASMIVNKAVYMVQKIGVPIVGVVENMSYFRCPDTGKIHYIFGPSQSEAVSQTAQAPLLAQIPVNPEVAELCDAGYIDEVVLEECQSMIEAFLNTVPFEGQKEEELQAQLMEEELSQNPAMDTVDPSAGFYGLSNTVSQLMMSKENIGVIQNADARGYFRGECGDEMQIDLRLAGKMIADARFMSNGCGITNAAGSMITKMAVSKSLSQAMEITPDELVAALEWLPADHMHCADLAVNTLREAIIDATDGHSIFASN